MTRPSDTWPPRRDDADRQHTCQPWPDAEADSRLSGHAITAIIQAAGRWYAENGEYATAIRFCPFCGGTLELGARPKPTPEEIHHLDQQMAWLIDFARLLGEQRRALIDEGYPEAEATEVSMGFARNFFGPRTPDFAEYIIPLEPGGD